MREVLHLQMCQNLSSWYWGLPSLETSEIEALKKGIGFIILPDYFFLIGKEPCNWLLEYSEQQAPLRRQKLCFLWSQFDMLGGEAG